MMKTVVVGGHTRNIGKTSVVAGLISALQFLDWTAVKITQYGHGICSRDGQPCDCEPGEHPFVLTEEHDPRGRADTCRFLAAGAKRALWLRVRQGQLAEAFPLLEQILRGDGFGIVESNSVLGFLEPSVYVIVVDSSREDFKPSARRYLERADAVLPVDAPLDPRAWPGIEVREFENKPAFPIPSSRYSSPELCRFVCNRLCVTDISASLQDGA